MKITIRRWFQVFLFNITFGCLCRGLIILAPTNVPWATEQWTLQCYVNPLTTVVTITNPGGTQAGTCQPASGGFPASCTQSTGNTLAINETANTISMTRTIADSDTGTWTCEHLSESEPYTLSSPLPNRTTPDSSSSNERHSMTATAGSELTSDTEHTFYFHYGCVSANLKFIWTTVPGSSWSDTSNTNSNSFACTTNLAYMSNLATSAAILKSVSSKGTQLKVSVYVDGYDNLAVAEYTYNVTFSPGEVSTEGPTEGPISQMSTSIATEGKTSINCYSIPVFSNITLPMISDSTIEISASSSSYFNTGSSNMNAHTESTFFYSNTETTHLYTKTEITTTYTSTETTSFSANTETTNVHANTETTEIDASTETYEIETKTLGIVSNYISIYQSMFATTAANSTPVSFGTTSQKMTEPFAPPSYSISSYNYNEITVPTVFKTRHFVLQTFSETSIALDFPKNSILSMTLSPSYIGNSLVASLSTSFSVASFMTDTPASIFEISNVSRVNGFSLTTETAQTLMTAAIFDPSVNSEKSEGVYSSRILSSRNSDMYISAMPSKTQLLSLNDIQKMTSDFQSTTVDQHSQLSYKVISSIISEYSENVLQSTSLLSSFYTTEESTETDSYMKTTSMQNFATQSSILTNDTFLFTNPPSIQISTVLPDFGSTLFETTINYNSEAISSMITPSSQRKNSYNSYNEIGTLSKDLSFFINSFSESVTSRELLMSTLSFKVTESVSTMSTNKIQSGLSEKIKNIIFISITTAVVTIIIVILIIIFVKLYMSEYKLKPRKNADNISWCNNSCSTKAAFPDYSFTGKNIYPMLDTSSTSFKMHSYRHNWKDIV